MNRTAQKHTKHKSAAANALSTPADKSLMNATQGMASSSLKKAKNKKNGLENHERLVESFRKQGTKFRRTLKYGFPVVARKTGSNEHDDGLLNNSLHPRLQRDRVDRLNQTTNLAFKNKANDAAAHTPLAVRRAEHLPSGDDYG